MSTATEIINQDKATAAAKRRDAMPVYVSIIKGEYAGDDAAEQLRAAKAALGLTDADVTADDAAWQSFCGQRALQVPQRELAVLNAAAVAAWDAYEKAREEWENVTRPRMGAAFSEATEKAQAAARQHESAVAFMARARESAPRIFGAASVRPTMDHTPRDPKTIVRTIPTPFDFNTSVRLTRAVGHRPAGALGRIASRASGDQFDPSYAVAFSCGGSVTVTHSDLEESIEPVQMIGVSDTRLPGVTVAM